MFTKRDLMKLLAPLIVEQILTVLVGMVDVVMVAAAGEAAVSGVSLVDSISILVIQILAALATGGAVVSAQYLGRREPENACTAAGQLILISRRERHAEFLDLFPDYGAFLSVPGSI